MSSIEAGTKKAYHIILEEMVNSTLLRDYLILHDLIDGHIYPISKVYLVEKELMTKDGDFRLEGFFEYAQSVLSKDDQENISISDFAE